MYTLFPSIPKDAKVCDSCRKELGKLRYSNSASNTETDQSQELKHFDDPSRSDPEVENFPEQNLETVNISLQAIGVSPVKKKRRQSKKYSTEKLQNIKNSVRKNILPNAVDEEESLMSHLKSVFSNLTRKKKITLLTILPENWSVSKIKKEFGASDYMVRQAKKLQARKGFLVDPDEKPGKSISPEICLRVKDFYCSDENSRMMPGKKDCISTHNEEGKKVTIQKRLILGNLRELYLKFQDDFKDCKIGFSKFCELRPKNCILAGPKGTHSVCVCTYHQNVVLMLENVKISTLTDGKINDFKDCLSLIMCTDPQPDCYLGNCANCPGITVLQSLLENAFDHKVVENVIFRQWIQTDRCNLETLCKTSLEFIEFLCEKIIELRSHHFITKQQSLFLKTCKENLKETEIIVIGDFSENYSVVLQDEAQSRHWTSDQVTVHPFVVYYKDIKEDKLKHLNFVVISECLEHMTDSVYLFQTKLINFVKEKFNFLVEKILYFSDGASSQYKNRKNFANLACHKADFGLEAEWHFFATAHGKGPSDGLGGTVKRMATRASLQRLYDNHIQTPRQLFEFAVRNIPGIDFVFTDEAEHLEMKEILKVRFERAIPIPGTREFHSYIPCPESAVKLQVKRYSSSLSSSEFNILPEATRKLTMKEINGYVVVVFNDQWWLSFVLQKNFDEEEVFLTFLKPSGPSPSYIYPFSGQRRWISLQNILCAVNPFTQTGRTYQLCTEDAKKAISSYEYYLEDHKK